MSMGRGSGRGGSGQRRQFDRLVSWRAPKYGLINQQNPSIPPFVVRCRAALEQEFARDGKAWMYGWMQDLVIYKFVKLFFDLGVLDDRSIRS